VAVAAGKDPGYHHAPILDANEITLRFGGPTCVGCSGNQQVRRLGLVTESCCRVCRRAYPVSNVWVTVTPSHLSEAWLCVTYSGPVGQPL
jgi:hypothetical protein